MARESVSATHARIHFGEVMRHVVEKEEPIFVERSGKPLVVVLSVKSYEKLVGRQRNADVTTALDGLAASRLRRGATTRTDSINEIINDLREERHEWFNGMP